ncbi:MAG: hypothetical protein OEY47_03845 [Candidatus Bathyarchaeota archaeon]|nr:hypothetical protein [Candidatus Bathyarchaeota archaeon]
MIKSKKAFLFGFLILSLLSTILLIGFTKSAEASPGLITMSLTIGGTQALDVDTGQVGSSSPDTDLWWEQVTSTERFLVPENGAELGNLGIVDFDSVVDCSAYMLSTDPINGSVDNNTIPEGTVLVVRTNIGNYAKMRIDSYGYDLHVTIVYQDDGSPIVNWAARVYRVEMLWNNSMSVNDVAVSKDGNYVVAVNGTGIYYFASNSSNPKWWYLLDTSLMSVAVSADGEYVVAGSDSGYLCYFNASSARTGQQLDGVTWLSTYLFGPVERGTLDMSDDGEYVVTAGTGYNIYYFAGCRGRSGLNELSDWTYAASDYVYTVHISSDGRYVVAGGIDYLTSGGCVVFFKDANTTIGWTSPDWYASSSLTYPITDVVVSDDGYAIVAINNNKLYYWANATNLSGDPNATWTSTEGSLLNLWSVDMSADGSDVVAGTLPFTSLHLWAEARGRQGNQTETWVKSENVNMYDVGITDDGGIIATFAQDWENATYYPKACFFKSDGSMIGEFDLPGAIPYFAVSISGDGHIVAMGSGGSSLYVFEVLEDSSPPVIEDVYQEPANDTVTADDKVMVYANVTDEESGVKQASLNYTNGNGTWITVKMTNLEGNKWNGTIPAFLYDTYVNYTVVAEDQVGNTITTEEMGYTYQYHVIPEFPSFLILPIFIIITLFTATILQKNKRKTGPTSKC